MAAELHVLAHMKLFLSSLLLLLIFLLLLQLLLLICVLLLQLLMLMFVLLLSVPAASLAQSLPASASGAVCLWVMSFVPSEGDVVRTYLVKRIPKHGDKF